MKWKWDRILDGIDQDVEAARDKMNYVTKRLSILLKTTDTGLLCTVIILLGIFFVLLMLVLGT